VLIACFYDWEEWSGRDAKYFTKCDQSSKETITIWKLIVVETPYYVYGNKDTVTVLGTDCKPGLTGLPYGPSPFGN